MKKTILIILFVLIALSAYSQTSRIPQEENNYFQNASSIDIGDPDQVNIIFFEVPDDFPDELYFAINDPYNHDIFPDSLGTGGSITEFTLFGGSGCFSDIRSRDHFFSSAEKAANFHRTGTLLDTQEFDNTSASGWYYFSPVNPDQGEPIGNKYYFKIVVEMSGGAGYKNGYQLDVSTHNTPGLPPSGIEGINSFAYSWGITILDNPADTWDLYPFVPQNAENPIIFNNFEFDTYETIRAFNALGDDLGQLVSSGGGTNFPDDAESASFPLSGMVNDSWRIEITPSDDEGANDFANTAEIFVESGHPGNLLRIYPFNYTPPVAQKVCVTPEDRVAVTDSSERLFIQITDSEGNPAPFIRNVWIELSSANSRIIDDNSSYSTWPAQAGLVTTNSEGLGWIDVTSSVEEIISITAHTNGAVAPGTNPLEWDNSLVPNQGASVQFSDDLLPVISSRGNLAFPEQYAQTLKDIQISDSGSANINAAADIRIVIPPELDVHFDPSITVRVTLNGSGAGLLDDQFGGSTLDFTGLLSYENNNKTAVIGVYHDFDVTQTLMISGLSFQGSSAHPSQGHLELDVGAEESSIDDKLITINSRPSAYTWVGGNGRGWSTRENWRPFGPPTSGSSVTISNTGNNGPLLDMDIDLEDLVIDNAVLSSSAPGLTIQINGSLTNNGVLELRGDEASFSGTMDLDSGKVIYTGFTEDFTGLVGGDSYFDLEFDCDGSVATLNHDLNVNHDLILTSGTLDVSDSNYSITIANAFTSTGGFFNEQQGTVIFTGAIDLPAENFYHLQLASSGTIRAVTPLSIGGDLKITTGTFDGNGQTISIAGSFINQATFTANHSTLIFTGSNGQSINPGNSPVYNLSKSNTNTLTLESNPLTITGTLSISSNCSVDLGALDFSINILENQGVFSLDGTQNTQTISLMDTDSGTTLYTAGAGDVSLHWPEYYALELNDDSLGRTFTLSQPVIIHENLTISSGTLDTGNDTNSITLGGNWLNAGGFISNQAQVLFNHNGLSTVTIDTGGTGDLNDFHSIEFNDNGAGAVFQLINNDLSANSDITITSGNLVTNDLTITLEGNWLNNDSFTAGRGTVVFSNANVQLVNSGGDSFFNISKTGRNRLYIVDSDITVTGTLSIDEYCIVTIEDMNFAIAQLENSERLEIGGLQTTQIITDPDLDSGAIRYTNAGGIIRLSEFYNLQIYANGTVTTQNDLTVLNNFQIMNGSFDGNAQRITISGNFSNSGVFTANYSSLVFNRTGAQSLTPGNSPMHNISKTGSDVLSVNANGLTATGTLFIDQGCVVDLSGFDFSLSTLDNNNGTLVIEGTQNIQQINTMDADTGLVLYTGESGNATIGLNEFYMLEINDDGIGSHFLLTQPIIVNSDLTITSGTLDVGDGANSITLGGNWSNSGSFISSTGTVIFDHHTPSSVAIDTGGTGDLHDFYDLRFIDNQIGATFQLINNHLDVYNNLTISSGTLQSNNFNITLGGNWTNTGSFAAGSARVSFTGNQNQRMNAGTSSFYNLTKNGNSRLELINSDLVVNNTLTIEGANAILDLGNEDFTIETLANTGVLVLGGLQSIQSIARMNTDSGTLRYTSDGGVMVFNEFWNLQIQTSGSISAPEPITINNDFQIISGTFDSNQQTITIGGDFLNSGVFTANNSTLIMNGRASQSLDPGPSRLHNLTKEGGDVLQLINNPLTITGTLLISDQNTVNLSNSNFTINTLNNQGTLGLYGTQRIQSIANVNRGDGTVVYLNGNEDGTIILNQFWNLIINGASRNYTLTSNITVDNDLIVSNGTLDAAGHTISLRRNFDTSSTTGHFEPRRGSIILTDESENSTISGNNRFFNLFCNAPNLKNIYFAARSTTSFDSGGTFSVIGEPLHYINIYSTIDAEGEEWNLNMTPGSTLDFRYVNVHRSDATENPIIVPGDVVPFNCINWLNQVPINNSRTLDLDNDGRIDAIDANVQGGVAINDNFSDIQIEIQGYEILYPINTGDRSYDSIFRIPLKEKSYLDTGTRPLWSIVSNTQLRDSATETQVVNSENHPSGVIPFDEVAPKIGYTLAIAERNQVFIHFSEQVNQNGLPLGPGDFTFDSANPVSLNQITYSHSGSKEVLLSFANTITPQAIYNGLPIIVNTAVQDMAGLNLNQNTHRVSDLGLGILNSGLVEPIWAQDQTNTNSETGGLGLATDFTGDGWLRDQDITLQAFVNEEIEASALNITLHYDASVDSSFIRDNLWLPDYDESLFNGLVPWPNNQARQLSSVSEPANQQLKNFQFSSDDEALVDNSQIEFFFQIPGQQLYCARIKNPEASDWYRQAAPWSLNIHDIVSQANEVSVLNNVINPDAGESVKLHYLLKRSGMVIVQVFDLKGDIVDIIERGRKKTGDYSCAWDGKNRGGRSVSRGMYFIKIVAPGIEEIRKVLVVK